MVAGFDRFGHVPDRRDSASGHPAQSRSSASAEVVHSQFGLAKQRQDRVSHARCGGGHVSIRPRRSRCGPITRSPPCLQSPSLGNHSRSVILVKLTRAIRPPASPSRSRPTLIRPLRPSLRNSGSNYPNMPGRPWSGRSAACRRCRAIASTYGDMAGEDYSRLRTCARGVGAVE